MQLLFWFTLYALVLTIIKIYYLLNFHLLEMMNSNNTNIINFIDEQSLSFMINPILTQITLGFLNKWVIPPPLTKINIYIK